MVAPAEGGHVAELQSQVGDVEQVLAVAGCRGCGHEFSNLRRIADATTTAPTAMGWSAGSTPVMLRMLRIPVRITAPVTGPKMLLLPPNRLTPPRTAAATELQLVPGAGGRLGGAESGGEQDPADRGEETGDGVHGDLDPVEVQGPGGEQPFRRRERARGARTGWRAARPGHAAMTRAMSSRVGEEPQPRRWPALIRKGRAEGCWGWAWEIGGCRPVNAPKVPRVTMKSPTFPGAMIRPLRGAGQRADCHAR